VRRIGVPGENTYAETAFKQEVKNYIGSPGGCYGSIVEGFFKKGLWGAERELQSGMLENERKNMKLSGAASISSKASYKK